MNRSISESILKQVQAQANEAKTLGFDKLASALNEQVSCQSSRSDNEEYVYTYAELKEDIVAHLWKAALQVQDYYGKTADGRDIAALVFDHAEDIIDEIRTCARAQVGAHEPLVPGETRERTAIEVDGDDE